MIEGMYVNLGNLKELNFVKIRFEGGRFQVCEMKESEKKSLPGEHFVTSTKLLSPSPDTRPHHTSPLAGKCLSLFDSLEC